MKTGIEIIAAERQRQIEQEGWTSEHVNDEMKTHGIDTEQIKKDKEGH